MKIEQIPIESLKPDPHNARKHNEKNILAIKDSLKEFGQRKPIVITEKNIVVCGNGTLEAARALGWKELFCVRTDLKGSKLKAFALADNQTGDLSEFDDGELARALEELRLDEFDLSLLHFEAPEKQEEEEKEQTSSKKENKTTIVFCPSCKKEIEI